MLYAKNFVLVVLLLSSPGCNGQKLPVANPGDPKAVETLEAHWAALQRGDWRAAYDRLYPALKASVTLKQFTDVQSKRKQAGVFPKAITIVGTDASGDDVVVSFNVLYAPTGGGEPVVVPPLRKTTLRRSGGTWGLLTHDVLAVMP